MRVTSAWAGCVLIALIPMVSALIMLFSDVNTLKYNKADTKEVMAIQLKFTEQMTKNTAAIESLVCALNRLGGSNEQQKRSD
jgi:hypothetical protein